MQKIKLGFAEETESNTKRLSIEVAEDSTVVAIEEGAAPVKAATTKKASPAQSLVFTNEKETVAWLYANGFSHCFHYRKPYLVKTEIVKLIKAGLAVPGCFLPGDTTKENDAG